MRRRTSWVLLIAIAVMLAACSSPTAPAPTAPPATTAPQPTAAPKATTPPQPTTPPQATTAPPATTAPTAAASAIATGQPIKVGINVPLTGAVGYLGQDEKTGYELALEEINGKGGVLGRPLQLSYADNQCNATQGVSAERKLIDLDKVAVTIGGSCSSATLGYMPVLLEAKIPNLVVSATSPDIAKRSGAGGNIWNFRLNVDDSLMAANFSKVIQEKAKTVEMIAPNNDFGRGAVAAYQANFEKTGTKLLGAEYFEQGQPDFRPALTKMRAAKPDALLLIMESRDAANMIRQMKEMAWTPWPTLFARGSVVTTEFAEAIKDDCSLGDGIMEATINANGVDPSFDQKFQAKYNTAPHLSAGLAYAGLYAVAKAIQAGGSADPAAIREGFTKLDYTDPIVGKVKFDDHNQNYPNMVITTMNKCQVKLLQTIPTKPQ